MCRDTEGVRKIMRDAGLQPRIIKEGRRNTAKDNGDSGVRGGRKEGRKDNGEAEVQVSTMRQHTRSTSEVYGTLQEVYGKG